MGACASIMPDESRTYMDGLRPLEYFHEKFYPKHRVIFDSIGMAGDEAWELFQTFLKIDRDWSGALSVDEFSTFFQVPNTRFLRRLLSELDEDDSGELDMVEFALGVYNICTMDMPQLARFIFRMFDMEKSGALSIPQFDAVLRLLYDVPSLEGNAALLELLRTADRNGDGKISEYEFVKLVSEVPAIVDPVMRLRQTLADRTLGKPWWRQAERARAARFPGVMDLKTILRAHQHMKEKDEEEVMRKQLQLADRLRKEVERDARTGWRTSIQESFAAMGEAQRNVEYALLRAKARLEDALAARQEVLAKFAGRETPPAERFLEHPPLATALRRRQQLLLEARAGMGDSIDEQRRAAMDKARGECRVEAERRVAALPEEEAALERDVEERLVRYREYIRHGGDGFGAIAEESFKAVDGAGSKAAARHAAISALGERIFEEQTPALVAHWHRILEVRLRAIDTALARLLQEVGIDDSHVSDADWERRWDPLHTRFFWRHRRTKRDVLRPPVEGDEVHPTPAPPPLSPPPAAFSPGRSPPFIPPPPPDPETE